VTDEEAREALRKDPITQELLALLRQQSPDRLDALNDFLADMQEEVDAQEEG